MAHLQTSTAYYSVHSASTSTNYNVFISHRGPDVKNTFAGHLYYRLLSHGFRPFFDREELQVGELLSLQIERAIITASVHIVIFSPGYADSRWCLDELLLILNKSGVTIIPVFYNLKPSELRWRGRYVQALNNHEQNGRYDHRTLEKWRKALYDISYIIGLELEAYNGDEGKLLDNVVQCVLKKRRKTGLNVARYPTGPPENVENSEITVSLQHRQNGKVKILCSVGVGMGMGGLVKLTTLAKKFLNKPSSNFAHGQVEEGTLINQDQKIVIFKMKTLLAATENFHEDNKLGEGGFGPVYKGTTQDGREIAVKKLSLKSLQGNTQFLNEIDAVVKIQHRNIVCLLGCCAEGSERMLVYEYLPNNSLYNILFDPYKRAQLDWEKRYNIIVGIVRGILYLHQDSQLRIVHRDIKASNILLDQKQNPKIADFGLAKILPDETHISPGVAGTYEDEIHITREDDTHSSTRVCGTSGYMAPEYAMQGHLSVKADVYSFGVLLLELVTGRRNTDYTLSPEMQILLQWAWRSYTQQNIEEMIDPSIIETCDMEQASRCIHVALLCTQDDSSLRPPMSTANFMLSSRSAMLTEPQKPAFLTASTSSVSDRQVPISSSLGDSLSLQSRGKGIAEEQVMPHSPLDFDHRPLVNEVGIDALVMFREEWDRLIQHRFGEGPSTQHCPRGAT